MSFYTASQDGTYNIQKIPIRTNTDRVNYILAKWGSMKMVSRVKRKRRAGSTCVGFSSNNVPSMRLQAKNSLNFTGLKDYFIDGKLSGFAYGYPLDKPTYSKDNKQNPFYDYRQDGFLFIVEQDNEEPNSIIPTSFELIVLEGAKVLISAYCKQLIMGGFDDELNALRKQAKNMSIL